YATVVGAQKTAAQIERRAGNALTRFGGNALDELDSGCRDSAEKAFGGHKPRGHGQLLFCRSRVSAARDLTASPPVTHRPAKVSDSGMRRCASMPPITATTS